MFIYYFFYIHHRNLSSEEKAVRYVQECLEEKYKDPDHVKSATSRGASSAENNLEFSLDKVKKDVDKALDVGQKQGAKYQCHDKAFYIKYPKIKR